MIGPATVLRRRRDVRFRHIPPETVLIRQAGPEVMVLNGVAGRLLDLVDGQTPLAGLVAALAAEYDAPQPTIERDVLEFAAELVAAEVLEVEAPR